MTTTSSQLERLDDYCEVSPALIETIFPDDCLPSAMWTAFFDLVDRKVYEWSTMRWMSNPLRRLGDGASATADEMVEFFNEITCAIDQSLAYASSSPTGAESNFRKWPTPRAWQVLMLEDNSESEEAHAIDVLLLSRGGVDEDDLAWDNVKASCVISSSHDSALASLGRVTRQLYEQQINRRFHLVITISGPSICVAVFDKGGLLVSEELDIDAHPFKFFRLILGIAYASPEWLGLDTSLFTGSNGRATVLVREEPFEVLEIIHQELALFGRSTLVLRCRSAEDDQEYVIKDCWMKREKKYSTREVTLMKRARGIVGVPTLVVAEALGVTGRDWLGERDVSTRLDSTGFLRGVYDNEYRRKGETILDHYRFVMAPVGEHLSSFSSKTELILAIADAIRAHEELIRRGILHRDISMKNILLFYRRKRQSYPSNGSDKSGSSLSGGRRSQGHGRRGLLIDLDKALDLTDQKEVSRAKDMILGTDLFMAHHIQDATEVHDYKHDLQSFFWVLVVMSLTHRGPKNNLAEDFDPTESSVLEDWWFGDDEEASEAKRLMAHTDKIFHDHVICHLPLYFAQDNAWIDCLWKVRQVIFQRSSPNHEIVVRALLRSAQDMSQRQLEGAL